VTICPYRTNNASYAFELVSDSRAQRVRSEGGSALQWMGMQDIGLGTDSERDTSAKKIRLPDPAL